VDFAVGRIRKNDVDRDRYLTQREGNFYYKRRVPAEVRDIDGRGEHVRISLKTADLAQARGMRDVYENADNELWSTLTEGQDKDTARKRYDAAVKRARAMGFVYRPSKEVAAEGLDTILQRIEAVMSPATPMPAVHAVLGGVAKPEVLLSDAFDTYKNEIAPHQLTGKSPGQRKRWMNVRSESIDNFIEVVGDLAVDALGRDDARKFYDHWMAKIAPKEGAATHGASIGNRRLGNLRVIYREYFSHIGEHDRRNPFEKMSFREKSKGAKRKIKRLPLSRDWITGKILNPGSLAKLNREARGIVLAVADTGARPSEICNLSPEMIVLDGPVPYLRIEPRDDPEDPREIKTQSSDRIIPITGLALEVFTKHRKGFPRYKDKESSLSATLLKFFRKHELLPSSDHFIYSLRHSFEDRMKEAGVDFEMRQILMGHSMDRPEYGEGGSLKLRQEIMKKVALPFDPVIV
jgi:integrase